ncbi:hypothetical protein NDU88_004347 [Pleurodeles waltl]|uniref:Uncharacterized protein n=1 Tax=Pleurodeles waltl TaxID=8319 RepID=A0AAV7MBF7_PLEWA|nr:hypothetical protein NDU88_004347 [Pleurodeles waltl]
MCGGFGPTNIDSGALAGWTRAALELRRSWQPATRVPLRGIAGRFSTSRVAEQAASCRTGLPQEDPSLLLSSSKPIRGSILARGCEGAVGLKTGSAELLPGARRAHTPSSQQRLQSAPGESAST